MTTKQFKHRELTPLAKFIDETYGGDLYAISHYISKAIYMMHYVQEGHFDQTDIQNVCFVLYNINESFYKSYHHRRMRTVYQNRH
jgi:hypothetical protein